MATIGVLAPDTSTVSALGAGGASLVQATGFPLIVEGDYAVLAISYLSTLATAPTVAGSGMTWTQLGSTVAYGTNRYLAAFGGYVTSLLVTNNFAIPTEPGTVNFDVEWLGVYRGVDPTTAMDVTPTSTTHGAGVSHAAAAITPTTAGSVILSIFAADNDDGAGATTFSGSPGGTWAVQENVGSSLGSDGSLAVYSKTDWVSGAVNLTVSTGASVSTGCLSLVLRPRSAVETEESFVARSATALFNAATGTFSRTITNPNVNPRLTPLTTDTAVAVMWANHASIAVNAAPAAPWVQALSNDYGNTVLQIYTAPWSSGLTWPTFGYGSTTDRFITYGLIIRGVDPTSPVGDIQHADNSANATITFPAVTPAIADSLILRMAFAYDDTYITGVASGGKLIVYPHTAIFSTVTGADCMAVATLDKLSGGAGISTGTKTIGQSLSVAYTAVSIAFSKPPDIKHLITDAAPDVNVTTVLSRATNGVFMVSAVALDLAVTTQIIAKRPRRNPARRAFLWVSGPNGNRTGVIS